MDFHVSFGGRRPRYDSKHPVPIIFSEGSPLGSRLDHSPWASLSYSPQVETSRNRRFTYFPPSSTVLADKISEYLSRGKTGVNVPFRSVLFLFGILKSLSHTALADVPVSLEPIVADFMMLSVMVDV